MVTKYERSAETALPNIGFRNGPNGKYGFLMRDYTRSWSTFASNEVSVPLSQKSFP